MFKEQPFLKNVSLLKRCTVLKDFKILCCHTLNIVQELLRDKHLIIGRYLSAKKQPADQYSLQLKILFGLLFNLTVTIGHTQNYKFDWVKAEETKNTYSISNSIATDHKGNVYVAGGFVDTVDFNPGKDTFNLIAQGSEDVFIQKLDDQGKFEWAKAFGNRFTQTTPCLTIDVFDNIYITGTFFDTMDANPNADTFNLIK
jgi:hypothetical protein